MFKSSVDYLKVFALFVNICILKIIIDYLRNNMVLKYTINFDETVTQSTFNKILSLPLMYHHTRPIGDIISRINDLSSIKELLNNISFSLIIDFVYVLMISIILFIINKIIFLIVFIMILVYVLIYFLYRKNIENLSYNLKEEASISNTYLTESLIGIDTIKNLNIQEERKNNFKNKYKNFLNIRRKLSKLIINYELFENLICNLTIVIIIYIGILFLKKHFLSIGSLISINSLVITLFISLKNLISLDNLLIEAKNARRRLLELDQVIYIAPKIKKLKNINKIEFDNISYSYDDVHKVIDNISFTINKGDFVFIKGNSGTGKSTIFKLLTKVLYPDDNMIKINNIDINNISEDDIRENICYVSQNEYIFTDTILDNIRLFKKANEKRMQKIIKITDIDKILEKRNITLDFLLEENGHNLSGGERQRILIARSLFQDKKILVLDETMSELDIQSEREIIKKIKTEYNITLIFISHRDNNSDLFNKVVEV